MNKKIKEALQGIEHKVFYGIGRFQNRNNWDCIVYGRRRKGKTESGAGENIRYFVAIVKEEEIPEGMEENILQVMKKLGFKQSNTETTYDYVEKSGETMVEIATMEFSKVEKRCRV